MNREKESHVVPALIFVVGVVAFGILIYLFLLGADWMINQLFGASGGIPI
jgi:hypothetical protein